jgi:hypothetical protein
VPIHFEVTERPVGPEYSYRITYKFDLSTDDVNRPLVVPYVAGEPLVIDGRIIRPSNIDEIRVVETPEPSAVLLPEIERRLKETHGVSPATTSRRRDGRPRPRSLDLNASSVGKTQVANIAPARLHDEAHRIAGPDADKIA